MPVALPRSVLVSLLSFILLSACDGGAPAQPTPSPSASLRPAASAAPSAQATSPSGSPTGPDATTPVDALPAESASAIETAFSRCEASYLDSLKTRFVLNPSVERVLPYLRETSEPGKDDTASQTVTFYLRLRSNFVYQDPDGTSNTQGQLLREVGRCRVRVLANGQVVGQSSTTFTEPATP